MKIKLNICYDGNFVNGWQGNNGVFIESELSKALYKITKQETKFFCAGRTDSGVHALNQTIHFECDINIDLNNLQRALNFYLPKFIRVLKTEIVDDKFHARFSAKRRNYMYQMYSSSIINPFMTGYSLKVPSKTNFEKIELFLPKICGLFDFKSFCHGKYTGKTNKSIDKCYMESYYDNLGFEHKRIFFSAISFSHHQIRNLVGGFLKIGLSQWTETDFWNAMEKKDRKYGPFMVRADGLYFLNTEY